MLTALSRMLGTFHLCPPLVNVPKYRLLSTHRSPNFRADGTGAYPTSGRLLVVNLVTSGTPRARGNEPCRRVALR